MPEPSLTDCEECLPPEDAFGVLASDTRLAILEALWEAEEPPVSFSALRREVEMRDSAQFNYHLDKLRDQFVRKGEDGYELAYAGRAVIQAVVSGTFNEQPEIPEFDVEGTCADCGGSIVASYEDELFSVACGECGRLYSRYPFPPGGLVDRSREELLQAFDQRLRHFHCLMADGVCPHCGGKIDVTIHEDDDTLDREITVAYTCQNCDTTITSGVGMAVLDDAEVVSFHRDHDVDLNDHFGWTLPWIQTDDALAVVSTDPWRFELAITLDDEVLELVVDEDLRVVDADRRGVAPAVEDDTASAADD